MKEDKDYTVLAQVGSEKPFYQFQLVRDRHGRGFGIIQKTKVPLKFFSFLKKVESKWLDMQYIPGRLEPDDHDFDDAFTFDAKILSKRFEIMAKVYLFKIDNMNSLLQSMQDDERGRYVI